MLILSRLFLAWLVVVMFRGQLTAQTVGQPLPAWTEGQLDIHQINTGKGNSTLFILPDGTSMMLDAGWGGNEGARGTPARPNESRNPGEWIARYARHMLSFRPDAALDYALLTHFHGDHMGGPSPKAKVSQTGGYQLTGITEVGEHLPIRKMLDRGWPDYSFPRPLTGAMMDNYRAFLKTQSTANGMKVERFVPGRNDQLVLLRAPAKYPSFEIRNVLANTEVWTGVATNTRQQFPPLSSLAPEQYPDENPCSLGFRVSYGKFDYGTFGDIPGAVPDGAGPVWVDMESPVARAVGPLDAVILNHHGNRDSTNAFYLSSVRPQVFIVPVWSANHPGEDVLTRMYSQRLYPGPRDVFATNMTDANRAVIGANLDRLKSSQGHILIRVDPGGATFRVVILDDATETYQVKAVFGPYQSR
jgi:beta-lactamase superfamily II metal-dependent hydrolase